MTEKGRYRKKVLELMDSEIDFGDETSNSVHRVSHYLRAIAVGTKYLVEKDLLR